MSRVALSFAAAAMGVLAGGWAVARVGDALAKQTGLGSTVVGAVLVALATSLPELSTTLSAVGRGEYKMAFSNIFGTNCIEVALFFLADLCDGKGPILQEVQSAEKFTATLGIVLTCVYLWGLLERKDRTILRMGVGSAVVLVLYFAGIGILWTLRSSS